MQENIPISNEKLLEYVELARRRNIVGDSTEREEDFTTKLKGLCEDTKIGLLNSNSLRLAPFKAKNELLDLTFQELVKLDR